MARNPATSRILIKQCPGAIVLNGTSQYVDLGNAGAISTITGAFTLSAWFRRAVYPGVQSVVGDRGSGALQHFTINFNSSYRSVPSLTTSGGGPAFNILTPYPVYQWVHGAIRYDTINGYTFRTGQLESQATRTGTVTAPTANMSIGSGNGAVRFWGGAIADVKFWTRALSDSECFDVYANRDDTGIRSGMVSEWKLASNVNDTFGLNNGTAVASPTFDTFDVPYAGRSLASNRVLVSGRTLIT